MGLGLSTAGAQYDDRRGIPMTKRLMHPITLILALSLIAGTSLAQQPGGPPQPPQIAAEGTAEVRVAPDRAIARFGVQTQAREAQAAQARVNETMQKVVQAVRRLNVPENRITTERLELSPVYEQPAPGREGAPRLAGYRAANVVRVELEATARLGPVIDAAVGAGANTIEGIQFALANEAPHRTKALQQAAQEAREKVRAIAETLGVRVDRLIEAREGGVNVTPPPVMFERAALASAPVQPGEITVRASILVRYAVER
jgi:uncharacterized protein